LGVWRWHNAPGFIPSLICEICVSADESHLAAAGKSPQIMKTDVPSFDQMVKDQNNPATVVKPLSTSP
jgi:hypothetical protein